ncbi:MAG: 16S rRNA (guanine(966)-N(2))-methyltransferase RsmD [Aquabacterium sp.]
MPARPPSSRAPTQSRRLDGSAPSKAQHAADRLARSAPQEVRIIGGQWRRTPLPVPVAAGLRPTPARVRETLFNWLGQDLSGWRVLDAFAGSGALGLEAASRGADEVWLLERQPALVHNLKAVQTRLKATQLHIVQADALAWMRQASQAGRFDLVFLDPPFDEGLFWPALEAALPCVPEGGWLYLEAPEAWADLPGAVDHAGAIACLRLHRHGHAGAVHFHLFQRVPGPTAVSQA